MSFPQKPLVSFRSLGLSRCSFPTKKLLFLDNFKYKLIPEEMQDQRSYDNYFQSQQVL